MRREDALQTLAERTTLNFHQATPEEHLSGSSCLLDSGLCGAVVKKVLSHGTDNDAKTHCRLLREASCYLNIH